MHERQRNRRDIGIAQIRGGQIGDRNTQYNEFHDAGSGNIHSGRDSVVGGDHRRQYGAAGAVLVVLIGAVAAVSYFYLAGDNGVSAAQAAYQKQVLGVCERAHTLLSAEHGEAFTVDPKALQAGRPEDAHKVRKQVYLDLLVRFLDGARNEYAGLDRITTPVDLRARKEAADQAFRSWTTIFDEAISEFRAKVRDGMTAAEILRVAPKQGVVKGSSEAGARLNGAMSDLAGQNCTFT
jgi:hypothetical protein